MNQPTDYIEKYEKNGKTFFIVADETPCDPRTEWDNLWNFVSNYRHYSLSEGDLALSQLMGEKTRAKLEKDYVVVPVYMYIHSGVALSLQDFNDPWDSGIGFMAYISKAKLREEYNTKRVTKSVLDRAMSALKAEVEIFGAYLNGDVYGCIVYDENGEYKESCFGFYEMKYAKEFVDEY